MNNSGELTVVPDYAKVSFNGQLSTFSSYLIFQVQGLLIGCVAAFVIFITIIGPEYVYFVFHTFRLSTPPFLIRNHGSHFEAHKTAFEEGAAQDDAVVGEINLKELSNSKQITDEKVKSLEG